MGTTQAACHTLLLGGSSNSKIRCIPSPANAGSTGRESDFGEPRASTSEQQQSSELLPEATGFDQPPEPGAGAVKGAAVQDIVCIIPDPILVIL